MAEEEVTPWNPWARECSVLFENWLQAAILSGMIEDHSFDYELLIPIVDNAERLELLGDLSRDKALLLIGLWMGRYQGNQDTGWWKPKVYTSETDIGQLKEACEDFVAVSDEPESKPFWETVARLLVAIRNLHPENVT